MNLQNLRGRLRRAVEKSSLGQRRFAKKHGLSASYLNKFLREVPGFDNPRLSTIECMQAAIKAELQAPRAPATEPHPQS